MLIELWQFRALKGGDSEGPALGSAEFLDGRRVPERRQRQCDKCCNMHRDCWVNLAQTPITPLRVSSRKGMDLSCFMLKRCASVWLLRCSSVSLVSTVCGLCTWWQLTHCDASHVHMCSLCTMCNKRWKTGNMNKVCLCFIFHMHLVDNFSCCWLSVGKRMDGPNVNKRFTQMLMMA